MKIFLIITLKDGTSLNVNSLFWCELLSKYLSMLNSFSTILSLPFIYLLILGVNMQIPMQMIWAYFFFFFLPNTVSLKKGIGLRNSVNIFNILVCILNVDSDYKNDNIPTDFCHFHSYCISNCIMYNILGKACSNINSHLHMKH